MPFNNPLEWNILRPEKEFALIRTLIILFIFDTNNFMKYFLSIKIGGRIFLKIIFVENMYSDCFNFL